MDDVKKKSRFFVLKESTRRIFIVISFLIFFFLNQNYFTIFLLFGVDQNIRGQWTMDNGQWIIDRRIFELSVGQSISLTMLDKTLDNQTPARRGGGGRGEGKGRGQVFPLLE